MSQDNAGKPKIIVDSDWKAQAEREKEQLAAKLGEDKKPEPKPGDADGGAQGQAQQMPKADFLTHCASVATQAMIFMGAMRHPMTGEVEFDPIQARYLIDTLGMLKEKSKGNLDAKETQAVDEMLGELKMVWVQVIQEIQRQQAAAAAKGIKG